MTARRFLPLLLTVATVVLAYTLWAAEPATSTVPGRTPWEHLVFEHHSMQVTADRELAKKINQLGYDGWEMFSVVPVQADGTTRKLTFFFKRPKQ